MPQPNGYYISTNAGYWSNTVNNYVFGAPTMILAPNAVDLFSIKTISGPYVCLISKAARKYLEWTKWTRTAGNGPITTYCVTPSPTGIEIPWNDIPELNRSKLKFIWSRTRDTGSTPVGFRLQIADINAFYLTTFTDDRSYLQATQGIPGVGSVFDSIVPE